MAKERTQEYRHADLEVIKKRFDSGSSSTMFLYETLIPFQDRGVLALQGIDEYDISYVVVPGFVEEYKTKNRRGLPVSEVSIVPKELQEEIGQIVHKQGLVGIVNFWPE